MRLRATPFNQALQYMMTPLQSAVEPFGARFTFQDHLVAQLNTLR
jgi:hypothetical protein